MSSLHLLDDSHNWRMNLYIARDCVFNHGSCEAIDFGSSLGSYLWELPLSSFFLVDRLPFLHLPIWNFPLQDSRPFVTSTTQLIRS